MTTLFNRLAVVWFIVFMLVLASLIYASRSKRQAPEKRTEVPASSWLPTPPAPRPAYTHPRSQARPTAAESSPFASPGRKGELFTYGGPRSRSSTREHQGAYAIVDVETTTFSPREGDRVIEIAVARVDATGRIEDEFATLINPEGRDTGPVFVHGITNADVAKAPTFAEVAPELLARLDGAVVVAHNAPFEERFLAAEFARGTLARHAGIPLVDKHAALGDVRAVAGLLPQMLDCYRQPVYYGCPPYSCTAAPIGDRGLRLVTRAVELRKGTDGWMHSLMARLPMSAKQGDDAAVEAYLDALAEVLADGKIVGEEAKALAQLAGAAGMGGAQVAALNKRFLESLRDAAFNDDVLTTGELGQLTQQQRLLASRTTSTTCSRPPQLPRHGYGGADTAARPGTTGQDAPSSSEAIALTRGHDGLGMVDLTKGRAACSPPRAHRSRSPRRTG